MKRTLIAFLIILSGISASATDVITNIIITKTSTTTIKKPRSIPIQCTYWGLENSIHIDFIEDIGDVAVEVTNTTTGESYYEDVVSADGQAVITIAGTEGEYLLQMTTEDGDLYEGVFRIE